MWIGRVLGATANFVQQASGQDRKTTSSHDYAKNMSVAGEGWLNNLFAQTRTSQVQTQAVSTDAFDVTNLNESQKYDHYEGWYKCHADLDTTPGYVSVLGLRKETNTNANEGNGLYDDRIVVLWKDRNGTKHVREFDATTEPSARYEGRDGMDANGDKKLDLGRLADGAYTYRLRIEQHSRLGQVFRMTQSVNVERDTNHDGLFNDQDTVTNQAALDAGTSMLIHRGGRRMTGSAGCQTLPPDQFQNFLDAMRDTSRNRDQQTFTYVLVNAK